MKAIKLDQIDLRLLKALQADVQRPISEIAEEIGLTASPCYRRQRLLEEAGIVRGYVALLDRDRLGFTINAFVSVELASQDDEAISAFEAEIGKLSEVMECHVVTGDTDYLLTVVAADMGNYERFLKTKLGKIPFVRRIRSSFALRRVVYKTALPVEALSDS